MLQLGGIKNIKKNRYIWTACGVCGKQRWVGLKGGQPVSLYCNKCGQRDRRKERLVCIDCGKELSRESSRRLVTGCRSCAIRKAHRDNLVKHTKILV